MRLLRACVATMLRAAGIVAAQSNPPQDKPRIVRSIRYDHFADIPLRDILRTSDEKGVKLKVATPFDQQEIDHAKAALTEMLAGRGIPNARVEVADGALARHSISQAGPAGPWMIASEISLWTIQLAG
jgi:hypothetical protein